MSPPPNNPINVATHQHTNELQSPHPPESQLICNKPDEPMKCQSTSNIPQRRIYGFINKGNTRYLSAILQCTLTTDEIWATFSDNTDPVSPLIHSILKFYGMQFKNKMVLDPSLLLKSASNVIAKLSGTDFNLHQQQDAGEILEYLLQSILTASPKLSNFLKVEIANGYKMYTM